MNKQDMKKSNVVILQFMWFSLIPLAYITKINSFFPPVVIGVFFLALLTWLHHTGKHKLTMYGNTIVNLTYIFLLNQASEQQLWLVFYFLPPVLTLLNLQLKNLALSIFGSYILFIISVPVLTMSDVIYLFILYVGFGIVMFMIYNHLSNNISFKEPHEEGLIRTADIKRGIEEREFELYYQPQLDMVTRRVVGVEALIRWNHPVHDLVPPNAFIPVAEKTGLIIPLGEWVLREACLQAKEWERTFKQPLRIAVNVSLIQLRHSDFVKKVKEILKETNTEPSLLELEITETVAMEINRTKKLLNELKQLGVRISIDDFGTGYNSLANIKQFPIDQLKIDQTFIREANTEYDRSIIKSIIGMAKDINIEVVAEGVETQEHLNMLKGYECDLVQGYFYSKPLPSHEMYVFLDGELKLHKADA